MKQLLSYLKFIIAFMFLSTTVFTLPASFDGSKESWMLIMFYVIIMGIYLFYLVKTGIWNYKDEIYLKSPLALSGLILHLLAAIIFLIWIVNGIVTDTIQNSLHYTTIPMLIIGSIIGIYDIYKFNQGRKYRKYVQKRSFSDLENTMDVSNLEETIFKDTYNNDEIIRVESKISFKEYVEIMYILSYKIGMTLYISIIGLIMVIGSIVILVQQPDTLKDLIHMGRFLFGIFLAIGIPISIYFSAKKNYLSNKRLSEKIIYEFTNEEMKATGESFINLRKWAQTYKIEELKNWFLIYESNNVANLIPKCNMSEQEISGLRLLFMNIKEPEMKIKLKHRFD